MGSDLQRLSMEIRLDLLRMLNAAGSGHTGGAMGIADVLVTLYFEEMHVSPEAPSDPQRDRFVLSAAHMVPALYAVLAKRGYFPASELSSLRKFGSRLKGHTFRDLEIGLETTGGSLGQGLGIAVGMALAARLAGEHWRTYCVIGDGESDEGSIWESAMCAAKYNLANLCVIADRNQIQLSDNTENVMPLEPYAEKWRAFNWCVMEIDGNDISQVRFALAKAKMQSTRPAVIIANTIPGYGISFMENKWEWHGKVPSDAELQAAEAEIISRLEKISSARDHD